MEDRLASGFVGWGSLPLLYLGHENCDFYLVFNRFRAELALETLSNGSGWINGSERTQNEPRDQF